MDALANEPGSGVDDKAYRLLTGPDDAEFCRRVSDALEDGYVLVRIAGDHVQRPQRRRGAGGRAALVVEPR